MNRIPNSRGFASKLAFLLAGIFSTIQLAAEVESRQVQVQGRGATYSKAVANGLIEGVRQIKGVQIESLRKSLESLEIRAYEENGQSSRDVAIADQTDHSLMEATSGFVRSYQVMNQRQLETGDWIVDLLVTIADYKTPGLQPGNRRAIAVLPFQPKAVALNMDSAGLHTDDAVRNLLDRCITQLVQSRRFTVLDRQHTEEILKEKNLVLSPDAAPDELAKIGQVLGADYLLVGIIDELNIEEEYYRLALTGEEGSSLVGYIRLSYRIIVPATRQIKWSDSVEFSLKSTAARPSPADKSNLYLELLEGAADDVVLRALQNIYPLRIVMVQAERNLVTLNQGGRTIEAGDLYDVFELGELIRDPYTGEPLGQDEAWMGTVEIVRVLPKMTYARILDGDVTAWEGKDFVCRPAFIPAETTVPVSPPTQQKKGGTRLPFD